MLPIDVEFSTNKSLYLAEYRNERAQYIITNFIKFYISTPQNNLILNHRLEFILSHLYNRNFIYLILKTKITYNISDYKEYVSPKHTIDSNRLLNTYIPLLCHVYFEGSGL